MSLIALMVVWFPIEKLKFVVFKFVRYRETLFVNFDWICDDGDDDGGDDDDGIAVDVEVFTLALGRHSGSTFHRRGLSGAAVG